MGHRGRLIIERNGERAFFNIDGANTVQRWLVLGPEGVDKFNYGNIDSGWIEGTHRSEAGIYVNYDSLELLWFGGEDERYHFQPREDLLALMSDAWEGWAVSWAHSGLFDIARRCGLSLGEENSTPVRPRTVESWEERLAEVINEPRNSEDTYCNSDFLISVDDGKQVRAVLGHHPLLVDGGMLEAPPDLLLELTGLASQRLRIEAAPNHGLHLDLDSRTVHHWAGFYRTNLEHLTREGWDYQHLASEFKGHLQLASPTVTCVNEHDRTDRLTRYALRLIYSNEFHARRSAWTGRQSTNLQAHDWLFEPGYYRLRLALSLQAACVPKLGDAEAHELLDPAHITPEVLAHLRRSFAYPVQQN